MAFFVRMKFDGIVNFSKNGFIKSFRVVNQPVLFETTSILTRVINIEPRPISTFRSCLDMRHSAAVAL